MRSINNIVSSLGAINHLLATSHITTVLNKENNSVKLYNFIRIAAKYIGVSHVTLLNYMNKDKLLKGIFLMTKGT